MTPLDLIETARRLAESGAAQPTQADLRRAVSTAYYALFHCLAAAAADLLTGASPGSPEWQQVYRALEPGKVRGACQQHGALRVFPMEIRRFAEAFVELQKARQQADYAHEGQYSKLRVLADNRRGRRRRRPVRASRGPASAQLRSSRAVQAAAAIGGPR